MTHLYRVACILVLVTMILPGISSAADTGTIQGKVLDAETGEALRMGSVLIEQLKKGMYTDVKGSFALKNVPSGTYSVRFSYVGYTTKTVEGVVVKTGEVTTLNVVLSPQISQTEEIVVEARRVNDNQAALLTQRKNAAQVSDGISHEEIQRAPDNDAGQALRRVSGVTLMNDKFVQVRGVSERYSNTTLNGSALATTEPDKKSFAFDIFPAELLENATVTKSFTPDLPGNFSGGLVQLNTVDFPSENFLRLSLGSSLNNMVSLRSDKFVSSPGGSTDWLGIDDGSREMPAGMPENRRSMDALLTQSRDPFDTTGAKEHWIDLGKSFHNNLWKRNYSTASPNGSFSLSAGHATSLFDNEFGVVGSLTYNNSYALNEMGRNALLANRAYQYKLSGLQATHSINWGGILNLAYKLGAHSALSIKNVYNRSSDDEVVMLEGQDVGYQFLDLKLSGSQFVQKSMYATQIGGEHNLAFLDNSFFDWKFGYSQSERDEPDFRRLRYSRSTADSSLPYEIGIPLTQQGDGTSAGRFFSNLEDAATNAAFNFSIPAWEGKIKFGSLIENRNRSFTARSFTYIQARNGAVDIDLTAPPDSIFVEENFREDGIGIAEDTRLSDSYNAEEHLKTGYLMADMPFTVADLEFRFIGGVRYESNVQALNSFSINDDPVHVDLKTDDWLPSINLLYKATPSTNIRLSATQTLARPSLREFAPFSFFDFQTQSNIQGNPNLKRSLIQNYDIRFETFPDIGEVLSVSFFYKNFKDAIEETIFPQQSELTRTFANAEGTAINYGIELEARKSLSFLGDYGKNFLLNLNYSLIGSEVTVKQGGEGTEDTRPMWGQSPYTLNVGVYYVEPNIRTAVNVSYNTYGRRIVQVAQQGIYEFADPHVYELPRDVVDVSIAQPIIENALTARFVVRDLFNQPVEWEQGGVMVASTRKGRSMGLSLSYQLR